jgi:hypothetical protein
MIKLRVFSDVGIIPRLPRSRHHSLPIACADLTADQRASQHTGLSKLARSDARAASTRRHEQTNVAERFVHELFH